MLFVSVSGVKWVKVFSHDTSGGLFLSQQDAMIKNPADPDAHLFSVLSSLESLRKEHGAFQFKLCYPGLTQQDPPCNQWTQSSNPAIQTSILDFRAIKLSFPSGSYGEPFKGLGRSPSSVDSTLIDDSPERDEWCFALGAKQFHQGNGKIPGPYNTTVKKVELFVAN